MLQHTYRWPRPEIAGGLARLLESSAFYLPEATALEQALAWYRAYPRLHFADAYVAAVAAQRQAAVVSFDQALGRLRDVAVVDSPQAFAER